MSRVLIVEPDSVLAKIYSQALEHIGHEVVAVATAQDGIISADEAAPDLILLELQISGHNGVEFLYEFRSYAEWQNVPVIIHSLVPPAEIGNNYVLWKQMAIAGYLYKPHTTLEQLIRAVRQSLASSSPATI